MWNLRNKTNEQTNKKTQTLKYREQAGGCGGRAEIHKVDKGD